jgi:minor tail protein Z (GPZ)
MRHSLLSAKAGAMAGSAMEISFNWTAFDQQLAALKRPGLDRAVALALVDTAKSATAKAASAIGRHTGLRSARIKSNLYYDRVNVGDYETYLRSSRKLIPLIDYGGRQTGAGARAAKPWGRAQVFPGTFIRTMPGGHRGIFRRTGTARLPIKEMWGPGIWHTFRQPDVANTVAGTIRQRLPISLARRIKSEMRRKR